jgi:hypothetical protein
MLTSSLRPIPLAASEGVEARRAADACSAHTVPSAVLTKIAPAEWSLPA